MRGVHAMEVVAFDNTGKALAFADTDHIHTLANGKDIHGDLVADIQSMVFGTEFAQEAQGRNLIGLQVTQFTAGQTLGIDSRQSPVARPSNLPSPACVPG